MAKRLNDSHRIIFSSGKGLGRVKTNEKSWRAVKHALSHRIQVDADITPDQYLKLSKDEQFQRKSKPGFFVSAEFEGGKRKRTHVGKHSMICLDMDEVTPEQMEHVHSEMSEIFGYEFFAHTTRKSNATAPRWRFIFPLKRRVTNEEWEAISRIIAQKVLEDPDESMDAIDDVSFRYSQVMFLPSLSYNQKFETIDNEGELVDPDAILADFDGDWTDATQLPYSPSRGRKLASKTLKADPPREKPGVIGAWCRTYDVEDVIANHLYDIYEVSDYSGAETRYTYIPGEGTNGAIVYDDGDCLYSMHGTDPITGRYTNAFDLARIHLFEHLDEGVREGTSPSNLPSYKKMVELAEAERDVMVELAKGKIDPSAFEFDDDDEADEEEDDYEPGDEQRAVEPDVDPNYPITAADFQLDDEDEDADIDRALDGKEEKEAGDSWSADLVEDKHGNYKPTYHNIRVVLENDARVKGAFAFNEFLREPVRVGKVREGKDSRLGLIKRKVRNGTDGDILSEADYGNLNALFSAPLRLGGWGFEAPKDKLRDALRYRAEKSTFHPICDQLEKFEWRYRKSGEEIDPAARIMHYLGLPDDPYHRESIEVWLLAAICRVFEPGCKFDCVPILVGVQGTRKSTFARVMAMGRFKELADDFDKLDRMIESMKGGWICEMGELAGFRKAEVEPIKKFVAASSDQYRLAYATTAENHLRQCVFIGTTNQDTYLKDPTGNRRFWPWKIGKTRMDPIDTDGLKAELPTIWGAMMVEYRQRRARQPKGDLFLDLRGKEALRTAQVLQDEARELTVEEQASSVLAEYLEKAIPESQAFGHDDVGFETEDERMFLRAQVTPAVLVDELTGHPGLRDIRNLSNVLGKAMKHVEGWQNTGTRTRKFGRVSALWVREGHDPGGEAWVEKLPDFDLDDMLE